MTILSTTGVAVAAVEGVVEEAEGVGEVEAATGALAAVLPLRLPVATPEETV